MMKKILKISNAEILNALQSTTRQYFVGNLSKPQKIDFIHDSRLEIGISSYNDFQVEKAHIHYDATEYQYVINGWTKYLDIDTNEVYEFKKGDFYAIMPNTAYAQKIKQGTNILFIKVPSINDKKNVEINIEQQRWLEEKMKTIRTDYFYKNDAPSVNSIKPAAAVAIFNKKRELLMIHRKDNQKWTMPGGTLEFEESLIECALREVKEETNLEVEIKDIIGTYTNPNIRVAYSDGEVRQEFTIVYYGEAKNYDVIIDDESTKFRWVSLNEIDKLPLAESQKRRIENVKNYLEKGTRYFL